MHGPAHATRRGGARRAVVGTLALLISGTASGAIIAVTHGTHLYDLAPACSAAALADLPGSDGEVSLPEAICVANAVAGDDVIELAVQVTLGDAFAGSTSTLGGNSATPDITSTVTIRAAAASLIARSATPAARFRLFHVASGTLILERVHLVGGFIEGGTSGGNTEAGGGGIVVASGAALILDRSRMNGQRVTTVNADSSLDNDGNRAHGGAIYNLGTTTLSEATIEDAIAAGGLIGSFNGDAGAARGGAIYNGGILTVSDSTLQKNQVLGGPAVNPTGRNAGGAVYGAAIFNAAAGTLTILDASFIENTATPGGAARFRSGTSSGGAISNEGMIVSITGTRFEKNEAKTAFSIVAGNSSGGAIDNRAGGTLGEIRGSAFVDNAAYQSTITEVEINGSTFNLFPIAAGFGGDFTLLEVSGLIIPAEDVVFASGNNRGGAISNEGSIPGGIFDSTFTANEARGIDVFLSGGHGLGGAIANANGGTIAAIEDAVFIGNLAWGGTGLSDGGKAEGGAIWNGPGGRIDAIRRATFSQSRAIAGHGIPEPAFKLYKIIKEAVLYNAGWALGGAISNAAKFAGSGTRPARDAAVLGLIEDCTFNDNFAYGGLGITGGDGLGGAIYDGGNLASITGSTFLRNTARGQFGIFVSDGRGGALMIDSDASALAITGSKFEENQAEAGDGQTFDGVAEGGAIYNQKAAVSITDSRFRANVARGGDAFAGRGHARGGGIFSWNGPLVLTRVEILDGRVFAGGAVSGGDAEGGGIWAGHDLDVRNSRIDGNHVFGGTGVAGGRAAGGGIFARKSTQADDDDLSTVVIRDSNLSTNRARGGNGVAGCSGLGGGIFVSRATTEVVGTTLAGNQAEGGGGNACDGVGGGLHSDGRVTTVVNSTVTSNRALGSSGLDAGDGRGGGLFAGTGVLYILNSTVTLNEVRHGALGFGGFANGAGVFETNAAVAIFSSLLGANRDHSKPDNCFGDLTSLDYNIIGESDDCAVHGLQANNVTGITVDPLLGLANNGGPGAVFIAPYTHAIVPGGAAHDRGRCDVAYVQGYFNVNRTVTTDQRGGARAAPCDVGAFEHGATVVLVTDPVLSASPAPGPLLVSGVAGAPASREIAITNVGGASTLLDVNQVSVSPGWTIAGGLPIDDLGSAATATITVQCTVGTTAAGVLVVATNEPGAPQYQWNLSCSDPAAVAPRFASDPAPSNAVAVPGGGESATLVITNTGAAGTLLDVSNISANDGYVITGLPIAGLAAGASATITVEGGAENGLLVLQTNEPGTPQYAFTLIPAAAIPLAQPWVLALLALVLGAFAVARMR